MRNVAICLALTFGLALSAHSAVEVVDQEFAPDKVTLGVWNTCFSNTLAYAEKTGIPIVSFWAVQGCQFCNNMIDVVNTPEFREWVEEHPIVLAYKHPSQKVSSACVNARTAAACAYPDEWNCRTWTKNSSDRVNGITSGDFPFFRIYWKKKDGAVVTKSFVGRAASMPCGNDPYGSTLDKLTTKLIKSLNMYLGNYVPEPDYTGATFGDGDTRWNRLEAEAGTTSVPVRLIRNPDVAGSASTNYVEIVYPQPAKAAVPDIEVQWKGDGADTNRTIDVSLPAGTFTKAGEQVMILLKDAAGTALYTNRITYVELENSAANPYWYDERKDLQFGEWTVDLEAAKALARGAQAKQEDAYVLVSMQGSLWCPDCYNVERYVLGQAKFKAWAAAKKVALVSLDLPPLSSGGTLKAPTILSRELGTGYFDDEGKTGAFQKSGLGYLTRKMVSDEVAAQKLATNILYGSSNAWFHRPEDTNDQRTGVPIFVLLKADGSSVASRLTYFADHSPTNASAIDAHLKRLDEMIEMIGDKHEICNNDATTTDDGFNVNGGKATGRLSHADFVDAYRLEGVDAGQRVKVVATGTPGFTVRLSLYRVENGVKKIVGESAVGDLAGVTNDFLVAEKGEYVAAICSTRLDKDPVLNNKMEMLEGFEVDSDESTIAAYTLASSVLLIPGESLAVYTPSLDDPSHVSVRMEKAAEGESPVVYLFTNLGDNSSALDPYANEWGLPLYTAKAAGDAQLALDEAGVVVTNCLWRPGQVAFADDVHLQTVPEADVDLPISIRVARGDGSTGPMSVRLVLDEEMSENLEGKVFDWTDVEFDWADGRTGVTNAVLTVHPDATYDGDALFAFRLKPVAGAEGYAEIDTNACYYVKLVDTDPNDHGTLSIIRTEPTFYAGRSLVAPRDAERPVKIYVGRVGTDGTVAATVQVSGGATLSTNRVEWLHRDGGEKEILVYPAPTAGSVSVTIGTPVGGAKIPRSTSSVTISYVNPQGPEFTYPESFFADLSCYQAFSNELSVVRHNGGRLSFTKMSGTLPAGLSVKAGEDCMVIVGTPTRAGSYAAVYRVTERTGSAVFGGLTATVRFEIADRTVDPATGKKYTAFETTRTLADVPVFSDDGRLDGLLTVTLPSTGKVSAKYLHSDGTMSFSAKSWEGYAGGALTAVARSAQGATLTVVADVTTGAADFTLAGLKEQDLNARTEGLGWSKASPATDWQGYYTVHLPNASTENPTGGLIPDGDGVLTLKLSGASACQSGKFTYAGYLPNGTSVSGSAVLSAPVDEWSLLPVFKRSTSDVLAVPLSVRRDAQGYLEESGCSKCVLMDEGRCAVWSHRVAVSAAEASYEMSFDVCGALYDGAKLLENCTKNYETSQLSFACAEGGTATELGVVDVLETGLKLNSTDHGLKITSFNRTTGLAAGTFTRTVTLLDGSTKSVTANWRGVVIQGWGPGCHCGEGCEPADLFRPFLSGAYWFSDTLRYDGTVGMRPCERTLSVKRGGRVGMDVKAVK